MKISEEVLYDILPSGSGIDCEWEFTTRRDGKKIRCQNSFHCMGEYGFYDGYADFSVIIPLENPIDFKLQFNGALAQRKNTKYLLRDYLEDIIQYAIESAVNQ